MGALAAVARFLERLFEGQSARLFHTRLRPIQVQRRIERAMESGRVRDGQRTVVPDRLVVRIAPDDLLALRTETPGLAATLADSALAFARAHGYTVLDRPTITLRPDSRIPAGAIQVDVAIGPPAAAVAGAGGVEDDDESAPSQPAIANEEPASVGNFRPRALDARPHGEPTAVFAVPTAEGPRATIREIRGDRSTR